MTKTNSSKSSNPGVRLMLNPQWVITGKGQKYFDHAFPMDKWEALTDEDRRVIQEQMEFLLARKRQRVRSAEGGSRS
jgi:hypothetical protein